MVDLGIPRDVAGGIDHLRAAVDAHKQATQASVDAGAQLRAEREQPAAPAEGQQ